MVSWVQLPLQVGWGPRGMWLVLWGHDGGKENAGDGVMLAVCLPIRRNRSRGNSLEAFRETHFGPWMQPCQREWAWPKDLPIVGTQLIFSKAVHG